jgi:RNA polymerase sigma factor (sigma-70 family)
MTKKQEREILDYASSCVDGLEKSRYFLPMDSHDWKDVKQEILIRVAQNFNKLDLNKGFKGYVKKSVFNSFKNQIRDRSLAGGRFNSLRKARFAVNGGQRISTKIVQVDDIGNEEVVYEPDISEIKDKTRERFIDIVQTLPPMYRLILRIYHEEKTWKKTAKRLSWSFQDTYRRGQEAYNQIRELSKTF